MEKVFKISGICFMGFIFGLCCALEIVEGYFKLCGFWGALVFYVAYDYENLSEIAKGYWEKMRQRGYKYYLNYLKCYAWCFLASMTFAVPIGIILELIKLIILGSAMTVFFKKGSTPEGLFLYYITLSFVLSFLMVAFFYKEKYSLEEASALVKKYNPLTFYFFKAPLWVIIEKKCLVPFFISVFKTIHLEERYSMLFYMFIGSVAGIIDDYFIPSMVGGAMFGALIYRLIFVRLATNEVPETNDVVTAE